MERINKQMTDKKTRPIKVVQFGEGNFLRGFVDYMIDIANEQGKFNGDIVMIKPRAHGNLDIFHEQECQYTVSLRGVIDGGSIAPTPLISFPGGNHFLLLTDSFFIYVHIFK